MRRIAFVVFILGICVLLLSLNLPAKTIHNKNDLEKFEVNQKVFLSGEIVNERIISLDKRILLLENGIEVVCECAGSFDGRAIEVIGVVSNFDGKRQVEALKISIRDS